MTHMRAGWLMVCGLVCGGALGCNQGPASDSPELLAQRARLLLASEPADAVGVLDAREQPGAGQQVRLVGRIGGMADPWTEGQAAFVMTDPSAAATGHEAGACSDGCPFCADKQDATRALAVVQFVDPSGKVLPYDARQLFGLRPDDTVVVEGRIDHNDGQGPLLVSATGLYIRR
jgi:hypothetical protein